MEERNNFSVHIIEDTIKADGLIAPLQERASEVEDALTTHVLPSIDGHNYSRLSLFFRVISDLRSEERADEGSGHHERRGSFSAPSAGPLHARDHLRALRNLDASKISVDYHQLMDGVHAMDVIDSSLSASTVGMWSKLASRIPDLSRGEHGYHTPNDIYLALCKKVFEGIAAAKHEFSLQEGPPNEWLRHYESCRELFSHLSIPDVREVSLVFEVEI